MAFLNSQKQKNLNIIIKDTESIIKSLSHKMYQVQKVLCVPSMFKNL